MARSKTTNKIKFNQNFCDSVLYVIYTGIEKYYYLWKIRQRILSIDMQSICGLCNFFANIRTNIGMDCGENNKDLLVDLLLDYLARSNNESTTNLIKAMDDIRTNHVHHNHPSTLPSTKCNASHGKRLIDLPACKKSIEEAPSGANIIRLAHQLLFDSSSENTNNTLLFNGYLPAETDPDPDMQVENTRALEVREILNELREILNETLKTVCIKVCSYTSFF
jgi:hypothetical protein